MRTVPVSPGTSWSLVLVPSLDFQGCYKKKVLVWEKPVAEMSPPGVSALGLCAQCPADPPAQGTAFPPQQPHHTSSLSHRPQELPPCPDWNGTSSCLQPSGKILTVPEAQLGAGSKKGVPRAECEVGWDHRCQITFL